MDSRIPDLWGDEITPNVLTPLVILRAQIPGLERRSGGVLEAEVITIPKDEEVTHHFDLTARAFYGFRERILSVTHDRNHVYPVKVMAATLGPNEKADSQKGFIDLVGKVLKSPQVLSAIQSLIARSNEVTLPTEHLQT